MKAIHSATGSGIQRLALIVGGFSSLATCLLGSLLLIGSRLYENPRQAPIPALTMAVALGAAVFTAALVIGVVSSFPTASPPRPAGRNEDSEQWPRCR